MTLDEDSDYEGEESALKAPPKKPGQDEEDVFLK